MALAIRPVRIQINECLNLTDLVTFFCLQIQMGKDEVEETRQADTQSNLDHHSLRDADINLQLCELIPYERPNQYHKLWQQENNHSRCQFIENGFGYACRICDSFWFKEDLKTNCDRGSLWRPTLSRRECGQF